MKAQQHTLEFLDYIMPAAGVIILAALDADGNMHIGKSKSPEWAARTAINLTRDRESFPSVYYMTNPAREDALPHVGDRRYDVLRCRGRSLSNHAVAGRHLYFVDVEPIRPAGVCATEAEKALVPPVVERMLAYLTDRGWPEPIRIDSGNGMHLLWLGDLCDANHPAWPFALGKLSEMFSTAEVKVDSAVANAARLARLPGTWNGKGQQTEERPHRRCRVLSYPISKTTVTFQQAYKLAVDLGYQQSLQRKHVDLPELRDDVEELIEDFIEEGGWGLSRTTERGGLQLWVLDACPFAGRRHSGDPNKTAITLGEKGVGFRCLSDECDGLGMSDLRKLFHAEHGHWPKTKFYLETEDRRDARIRRESEAIERYYELVSRDFERNWEVQYDRETYRIMASGMLKSKDPADYGLSADELREPFSAWLMLWARDRSAEKSRYSLACRVALVHGDAAPMGNLLGPANLFAIARDVHRGSYLGWDDADDGWWGLPDGLHRLLYTDLREDYHAWGWPGWPRGLDPECVMEEDTIYTREGLGVEEAEAWAAAYLAIAWQKLGITVEGGKNFRCASFLDHDPEHNQMGEEVDKCDVDPDREWCLAHPGEARFSQEVFQVCGAVDPAQVYF